MHTHEVQYVQYKNPWVPVFLVHAKGRKERLLWIAGGVVIKFGLIRRSFSVSSVSYLGACFVGIMTKKVTLYFSDISGSKEVSIC